MYAQKLSLTLDDLLTSLYDTCHSKIKRGTELYFVVLSVINLIQPPNTQAKIIRIVIVSI